MQGTTKISTALRSAIGTKRARRLREQGLVPGIIYGHKQAPIACTLVLDELVTALQHGAHVVSTGLDGSAATCLIKAVQYDWLGEAPIHVDLTRLDLTEQVEVSVPIELRGTPAGASQGGLMDQLLGNLTIACVATQIPESIVVRVNALELGQSLHVRDVALPDGVTAVTREDEVVCTVRVPGSEPEDEEEASAEGESGTGSEPEVIGRAKSDEGEGESS